VRIELAEGRPVDLHILTDSPEAGRAEWKARRAKNNGRNARVSAWRMREERGTERCGEQSSVHPSRRAHLAHRFSPLRKLFSLVPLRPQANRRSEAASFPARAT